jgi:hypothetical protein
VTDTPEQQTPHNKVTHYCRRERRNEAKDNTQFDKLFNQNARGWNNSTKVETAIQIMIGNNIGVMTIQETWRPGNKKN